MSRTACLALLALIGMGCAPSSRALEWEIAIEDAPLRTRVAVYEARVMRGECADEDAVLVWRARFAAGASADAPPELAPGTYALWVIGEDEGCRPVLAGCRAVDLPRAPDTAVRVELSPADGPACAGCDAGTCPADAPPREVRTCEARSEVGAACSDGSDDDCDRSADCGDTDCAGTSACECEDGGCGACERCLGGRCTPVDEGTSCTSLAGEGRCVRGACCNGCAIDETCAPGTSPTLCGMPGSVCAACACPLSDACEEGACVERGPAVEVLASEGYSCEREAMGALRCWGDGTAGRLGTDSTAITAVPDIVRCTSGSASCNGWRAPSLSPTHACAIRSDGMRDRVACWGGNEHQQLGRGAVSGSSIPQFVGGAFGGTSTLVALDVDVGDGFTCAVVRDPMAMMPRGHLYCWGDSSEGRLGVAGASGDRGAPVAVNVPGDPDLIAVALGRAHGCVTGADASLHCWGSNEHGQVGNGSAEAMVATPVRVGGASGAFTMIDAGGDHTCARRRTSVTPLRERVDCWGRNDAGQLGVGDRTDRRTPVALAEFPNGAYVVSVGRAHSCVMDPMGRLSCFGDDTAGQIGAGAGVDTSLPVAVLGMRRVISVAAGGDHTCAAGMAGEVLCWGDNTTGECGRTPLGAGLSVGRACP